MIIKRPKIRGIQITTIFKFLNFTAVFTQLKVHLSDGIDRACTFQIQTSNSLSISAQILSHEHRFLSKFKFRFLILLVLNTRISHEWLFQNLRTKYVSLSDGRNAHEHSTFINPSNSAF